MHASPARACGIDFGTSNSTVGWLRPGQPTLLTLEDGKPTLPSVVFFNAEADTVSVGRNGLSEYLAGTEGRLMRSLKSLLGSSLIDGRTEVNGRAIVFRDSMTTPSPTSSPKTRWAKSPTPSASRTSASSSSRLPRPTITKRKSSAKKSC